MSTKLINLKICGNVLSTDSYNLFVLHCIYCEETFSDLNGFIQHVKVEHIPTGGTNGHIKTGGETIKEELIKEDNDIKTEEEICKEKLIQEEDDVDYDFEIEDMGCDKAIEDSSNGKGTELSEEHQIVDITIEKVINADPFTNEVLEESFDAEDLQTDDDMGHKLFSFNLDDELSQNISLEFLKLLEQNPALWYNKDPNYEMIDFRRDCLTQIKLHLEEMNHIVTYDDLNITISEILKKHKKILRKMAGKGKLNQFDEYFFNKCKFLNEKENNQNDTEKECESIMETNSGSDNDDIGDENDFFNTGDGEKVSMSYLQKGQSYKRIRFYLPNNHIAIDYINLLRKSPSLWNNSTPRNLSSYEERKRIINSWIPILKNNHKINFTYDDLSKNLQILRSYYRSLLSRKVLDNSAKTIRKLCNFLPIRKNSKRIGCEYCGNYFLTQLNYKAHLFNVHKIGDYPFKCSDCENTFESAYLLELHTRQKHKQRLNFVCSICNRKFLRENELLSHMDGHAGIKKFICETCGKSFSKMANLRNHVTRIHLRQRNFQCHLCPKAFYTKGLLKDHLNAHLDIRNFKCPLCSRAFHSAHSLMRHKQIHSEVKRYACKLCECKFHQFVGLNAHMKSRHRFVEDDKKKSEQKNLTDLIEEIQEEDEENKEIQT